jgi:hypothetical protein
MLARVRDNAAQKTTRISVRGLDQQRDFTDSDHRSSGRSQLGKRKQYQTDAAFGVILLQRPFVIKIILSTRDDSEPLSRDPDAERECAF